MVAFARFEGSPRSGLRPSLDSHRAKLDARGLIDYNARPLRGLAAAREQRSRAGLAQAKLTLVSTKSQAIWSMGSEPKARIGASSHFVTGWWDPALRARSRTRILRMLVGDGRTPRPATQASVGLIATLGPSGLAVSACFASLGFDLSRSSASSEP